jgi:uncharacterized protein
MVRFVCLVCLVSFVKPDKPDKRMMANDTKPVTPLLPWWAGGLGIGLVLTVAVALAEPIGVSMQYVVLDGVLLNRLVPGLANASAYFTEDMRHWSLATYEFFFVLGIPLGAFLAAWATNRFTTRLVPSEWAQCVGTNPGQRLWASFVGGFLLLFGARFGGGCTSGHVISGISQLAVSSFLFSMCLFVSAMLTARWLYGDGGRR